MPTRMSWTGATLEARSKPFRQHPQVEQLAADPMATGTVRHHRVLVNPGETDGEVTGHKTEVLPVSTAREEVTIDGHSPTTSDRLHRHRRKGDQTGAMVSIHDPAIFRHLLAKADTPFLTHLATVVLVIVGNADTVHPLSIPTFLATGQAKSHVVHETQRNDRGKGGADPETLVIRAKATRTIDRIVAGALETEIDPETHAISHETDETVGLVRAARNVEIGLATETVIETETFIDVRCRRRPSATRHLKTWIRRTALFLSHCFMAPRASSRAVL